MENQLSEITVSYKKIEVTKGVIRSSEDSNNMLRIILENTLNDISLQEKFFILYLNNSNRIVGYQHLTTGTINQAVVDTRLLFSTALLTGATSVIISHNHPSGNMTPSQADLNITKKIKNGLGLLDITLLDHIILSGENNDFYSFADNGLI